MPPVPLPACRRPASDGTQVAARIGNILDQARSRTPLDRRRLLFGALATAALVLESPTRRF